MVLVLQPLRLIYLSNPSFCLRRVNLSETLHLAPQVRSLFLLLNGHQRKAHKEKRLLHRHELVQRVPLCKRVGLIFRHPPWVLKNHLVTMQEQMLHHHLQVQRGPLGLKAE